MATTRTTTTRAPRPARRTSSVRGFYLPWTQGARAYPEADSLAAARKGLARRRKDATIILRDKAVASGRIACSCCGEPITAETGNRTEYLARTKALRPMHYSCAWGQTLQEVENLAMRMR